VCAFVVLALTGLWLTRNYRPVGYPFARRLHNAAAVTFVLAAVAYAVLVFRSRTRLIAGGIAVIGALGGLVSGALLAWEQLALTAVTAGSKFNGVWNAAFSDQIRFILIGNSEISQSTYRAWVLVHLFAVPALLLGALIVAWRHRAHREPSQPE
jgi:quinol-cytochrome oxidoreductase complex cytochrome b subunit